MSETEESNIQPGEPERDIDWALEILVKAANTDDTFSPAVVLSVGGAMVGGRLIGGRQFFDGLMAEIKVARGEREEGGRTLFELFRQGYGEPPKSDEEAAEQLKAPVSFVHLKDARYFAAGQKPIPANRGVYWRGKLSAVDAFFFGSLDTETTPA